MKRTGESAVRRSVESRTVRHPALHRQQLSGKVGRVRVAWLIGKVQHVVNYVADLVDESLC